MLTHKGTQPLRTKRLLLRPYRIEDAGSMYAGWTSNEEVVKFLTWNAHSSIEDTLEVLNVWLPRYEDDDYYNWAIDLAGNAVGNIAVVEQGGTSEYGQIGYCLSRALWGKGYMTEAMRAVFGFLFGEVGFRRIYLRADAHNIGSWRVMEKLGMRHEGTLRQHTLRRDGSFADVKIYGLLREEWDDR